MSVACSNFPCSAVIVLHWKQYQLGRSSWTRRALRHSATNRPPETCDGTQCIKCQTLSPTCVVCCAAADVRCARAGGEHDAGAGDGDARSDGADGAAPAVHHRAEPTGPADAVGALYAQHVHELRMFHAV